jgi:GR25 family glycosyltransferase involved in LPS biosynthesis
MKIEHLLNLDAYVITMENTPERWYSTEKELKTHGFKNVHRFNSFDSTDSVLLREVTLSLGLRGFGGNPLQQSVTMAHLSIIDKLANSTEMEELLIFEDDIIFHTNFNSLINEKIANIPDCTLLHFGAVLVGGKWLNVTTTITENHIVRGGGMWLAHAYLINKAGAILILDTIRKRGTCGVIDHIFCQEVANIKLAAVNCSPFTSDNYRETKTPQDTVGIIYQKKGPTQINGGNEKNIVYI